MAPPCKNIFFRLARYLHPPTTYPQAPATALMDVKHSGLVRIDPDNLLPPDIRAKFHTLLHEHDEVFDPAIKGYNSAAGPF